MKTLLLLLALVSATPSFAADACNEETLALLNRGDFSRKMMVLSRAIAIGDMLNEISSRSKEVKGGNLFQYGTNSEAVGALRAYHAMFNFLLAEHEKLKPCMEAAKR